MHGPETPIHLEDDADSPEQSGQPLRDHPRIARLRQQVASLPVDPEYRLCLFRSLDLYVDQIVTRPEYQSNEGWDDLEALQQVTLSDRMEQSLRERCEQALQAKPD